MLSGTVKKKRRKGKRYTKYRQYDAKVGDRQVKVQGYEPQAIEYLTTELGISPDDIRCEEEFGNGLDIRYKYRGKMRTYFPDIYVISKRLIVEVKSVHTLGLNHNKQRGFSMTKAKAIACHEKGYKFMLLLLDKKGRRLRMPKNWPYMKKEQLLEVMPELNPVEERVGLFQT